VLIRTVSWLLISIGKQSIKSEWAMLLQDAELVPLEWAIGPSSGAKWLGPFAIDEICLRRDSV